MRNKTVLLLAVTALAGFLLCRLMLPLAASQEKTAPPPWEYKAVSFGGDEKENTRKLNDLAGEGWEYVGPLGNGMVAFRRAVLSPRDAAAKKDREKLQGTWYTVSISYGDTNTAEDKTDTITYEGDQFVQKRGGLVWQAGTFKIVDATSNPKQIDYVATEGEFKGAHWRSVYTLDGDDHQICSDDGNDNRPKEFSGKVGFHRVTKRQQQ
jgi:uncharacterized protein (TIGR03067 family)